MPRPYPATPRVAHNPEAMPRPYPATPRVAHNPEAMPRPYPATLRVAHNPEAMPRPNMPRPDPAVLRRTSAGEGQDGPRHISAGAEMRARARRARVRKTLPKYPG